jgi:hypothetical protein
MCPSNAHAIERSYISPSQLALLVLLELRALFLPWYAWLIDYLIGFS